MLTIGRDSDFEGLPAFGENVDVRTIIYHSETTAKPLVLCDGQAEGEVSRLYHALLLLNVTLDDGN